MQVILLIVSILLIIIVLLQANKAADAANITGGAGSDDLFANRKERGGEVLVSRATMILGAIFFLICLYLSF